MARKEVIQDGGLPWGQSPGGSAPEVTSPSLLRGHLETPCVLIPIL